MANPNEPSDDTIITVLVEDTDRTIATRGPAPDDERTLLVLDGEGLDEKTHATAKRQLKTVVESQPGIRIAFVPASQVAHYEVRSARMATVPVVRTMIEPSPSRRAHAQRRFVASGPRVIVLVVGVTLVVATLVVGMLVVVFRWLG